MGRHETNRPLTKEEQKLVEDNHGLIYGYLFMKNYDLDSDLWNDLYTECALGLMQAARTYKEDQGTFSNFAYAVMRNYCSNYFSKKKRDENEQKTDVILDARFRAAKIDDSSSNLTLKDTIGVYDNTFIKMDVRDTWYRALESSFLNEKSTANKKRDKEIVTLYYIDGYNIAEIANKFGISKQRVSIILKRFNERFCMLYQDGSAPEEITYAENILTKLT